MAGKIKSQAKYDKDGNALSTDTVLTFDNNKDYVVIELLSDGKHYPEHKFLADKLVAKKMAKIIKDAELEHQEPNTTIIKSN